MQSGLVWGTVTPSTRVRNSVGRGRKNNRTSIPARALVLFSVFQIQILRNCNKKVRNRDSPSSKTYPDLVGKKRHQRQNKKALGSPSCGNNNDYGPIAWIDKLLQTPIDDFRKRSRDLILFPYFVVGRGRTELTR